MLPTDTTTYPLLIAGLKKYSQPEREETLRRLCRTDLYFLLWYALGRADIEREWLFKRCREIQADSDNRLDLWAREHYKSTIITFGLTVQDILNNPELTIGIFSSYSPRFFTPTRRRKARSGRRTTE
jgi:hypothetical protein